jgi:hypothetical protein
MLEKRKFVGSVSFLDEGLPRRKRLFWFILLAHIVEQVANLP